MKENALHAFLATCDGDQPRLRSVSPIVEDDMTIWVTTYCSSRKVKQINQNPKICLAFIEMPQGEKMATVLGKAVFIDELDVKKRVWDLANFDLSQHFPDGPESNEYCVMKIIIEKIEWRESWTSPGNVYVPE